MNGIAYMQRRDSDGVETVDELNPQDFATWRAFSDEKKRLASEYNLSDFSADYYFSQRATQDWN